ncbi:LuxR family two component transcriptional regulator (plasmid) [Cylindrospermum sp. NIES-4074]|nr:LuxR family two component transcriptional regulator [Cylindrospermum sp. NIES-4074]
MIKTVIIDDHDLTRYGIRMLLSEEESIEICGEAETASEGLELIKTHAPDIALVNITLSDSSGIEITRKIKQMSQFTKVVIFNAQATEISVKEAYAAGADSYCTKTIAKEKLTEAIYATHRGKTWLDPAIGKILIQNLQPKPVELSVTKNVGVRQYPLSSRELEVLQMIALGHQNEQIAKQLFLSVGTVRSHVHRILGKLACQNRAQAAMKGIAEGLIDSPDINQIGLTV